MSDSQSKLLATVTTMSDSHIKSQLPTILWKQLYQQLSSSIFLVKVGKMNTDLVGIEAEALVRLAKIKVEQKILYHEIIQMLKICRENQIKKQTFKAITYYYTLRVNDLEKNANEMRNRLNIATQEDVLSCGTLEAYIIRKMSKTI
jgi:hypothetical protein